MNITTATPFLYRVVHVSNDQISKGKKFESCKMTYDEAEAKVKEMREREPGIKVWIEAAK